MDLSVLDVLQIFGRAGRPGYETSGVGYICTSHDKLDHYLYSIMSQHPIESKFIAGTVDALNAEIALGTIANTQEAIQWLGYTYLFGAFPFSSLRCRLELCAIVQGVKRSGVLALVVS